MGKTHVLAGPYPAVGHIIPLSELSQRLVNEGLNVTFVITEFIHEKVKNILATKDMNMADQIHIVMVKDGLSLEETRKMPGTLFESVLKIMPGKADELIEQINISGDHDQMISCMFADESLGYVAERKGIKKVAFWPTAAVTLVQGFIIPKLIDEGIINEDGSLAKKHIIKLSPEMPPMKASNLAWACQGNTDMQKSVFQLTVKNNTSAKKIDWLLCNSIYDLEPAAFKLAPQALPIGPLLSSHNVTDGAHSSGSNTINCLKWLDPHPQKSVIYIAFGSYIILDSKEFEELALGLELSNRPFLWVARTSNGDFPDGFLQRVANRRMVAEWAPQQKVLGHPSVGCFVSHCGWNSIIEGVSNGVPFLCWPYIAGHFIHQSYVCVMFGELGWGLDRDENGVITGLEIRSKVERVMGDEEIKRRALEFKWRRIVLKKEGALARISRLLLSG